MGKIISININSIPTLIILLFCTTLFYIIDIVFNKYIHMHNYLWLFSIGSYIVFSNYTILDYYLSRYSTSYSILAKEKRYYVLSNLIKGSLLLNILYGIIIYDIWDNNILHTMSILYCIPDFVSLFTVKHMSISTKIHHILVCIFTAISLNNDYTNNNVIRGIVVYAIFSVFTYLVNILLALKFYKYNVFLKKMYYLIALSIFSTCCTINWLWQFKHINILYTRHYNNYILLYILSILSVVTDDLILMKWLFKNISNGSDKKKKKI